MAEPVPATKTMTLWMSPCQWQELQEDERDGNWGNPRYLCSERARAECRECGGTKEKCSDDARGSPAVKVVIGGQ